LAAILALKFASLVIWDPSLLITPLTLRVGAVASSVTLLLSNWIVLTICWHLMARMLGGRGQYRYLVIAPGYALVLDYSFTLVWTMLNSIVPQVTYPASLLLEALSYLLSLWFLFIALLTIRSAYNLGIVRSGLALVIGLVVYLPAWSVLLLLLLVGYFLIGQAVGLPIFP
jgi:hypothetical protein